MARFAALYLPGRIPPRRLDRIVGTVSWAGGSRVAEHRNVRARPRREKLTAERYVGAASCREFPRSCRVCVRAQSRSASLPRSNRPSPVRASMRRSNANTGITPAVRRAGIDHLNCSLRLIVFNEYAGHGHLAESHDHAVDAARAAILSYLSPWVGGSGSEIKRREASHFDPEPPSRGQSQSASSLHLYRMSMSFLSLPE